MDMKDRIKERRRELNLTLDEVARLVGVSAATVSRWESGDIANMRRDKIDLLAKALRMSPGAIMGWEESDPPNSDEERSNSYYLNEETARIAQMIYENPELRILLDASQKVSVEDLQAVIEIVKRMKHDNE